MARRVWVVEKSDGPHRRYEPILAYRSMSEAYDDIEFYIRANRGTERRFRIVAYVPEVSHAK